MVRQVAEQVLVQQCLDLRLHRCALTAMDHAKQVVAPVRQAPWPLVAQGDARRAAQALADFIDQRIGHVQHQHRIGHIAQGAMVEHQADAAEQALFLPLLHLLQHLQMVGADLLCEVFIGPRNARQPTLQALAQVEQLLVVQRGDHGWSPRAKPRSMR